MHLPGPTRAAASRLDGAPLHGSAAAGGGLRISGDALKQGLVGIAPALLGSEDPAEFEALRLHLATSLHLGGEVEERAGLAAAWAFWLARRADRLLAQFLDASGQGSGTPADAGAALAQARDLTATFRSLDRHRVRLHRGFERAMDDLLDLVEEREAEQEAAIHAADAGAPSEPEPAPDSTPATRRASP
jgi:hypothetical protein